MRRTVLVLLLCCCAAAPWALALPPPELGRALPCARAQLIHGELLCDDELLDDLAGLHAGVLGSQPLAAGDAVVVTPARPTDRGDCGWCAIARVDRMEPEQLATLEQAVDLNLAGPEELASLPGIGPELAARIVAARPFASVDELDQVAGIGPKRLARIRRRARVTPRL